MNCSIVTDSNDSVNKAFLDPNCQYICSDQLLQILCIRIARNSIENCLHRNEQLNCLIIGTLVQFLSKFPQNSSSRGRKTYKSSM